MTKLIKENKQVRDKSRDKSLNIKIPASLDSDLKALRKRSREEGRMFNVSELVTAYLFRVVAKASDELLDLSMKKKREEQLSLYEEDSFDDFLETKVEEG